MESDNKVPKNLRWWNISAGAFHFIQAILIFVLSEEAERTLTTAFLKIQDLGAQGFAINSLPEEFVTINLGVWVGLFSLLSAIAHFSVSLPGLYKWYTNNLSSGKNPARWYEYSLSSSLMIIIIAVLSGVFDVPSLILLFVLNATMIWFGHVMEVHNQTTEKTNWLSYIYGCLSGLVPWIIIAWYVLAAFNNLESSEFDAEGIPAFVYWILGTLFIFFNSFALNMFLQYKKIGPWKNYLFGERVYIVLSFLAKTALAWQVFGGALNQPS